MTEEEWKIIGQILNTIKDRFHDQEKRIKHLEKQIELLTEDKKWIPEHRQAREAE
jgi:hypothetical protein